MLILLDLRINKININPTYKNDKLTAKEANPKVRKYLKRQHYIID